MEDIFPKIALKTAHKTAISVFFRGLRSISGYFLGFSKNICDEHTYHFYIKSASPSLPQDCSSVVVVVSEPKVAAKEVSASARTS